jgi:hypothetical protein
MINFRQFATIQFTTEDGVSLEELSTYISTQLVRLPTAPGNPFAARVAAMTTAYGNLETSLSDGPLKLGIQKMRTELKDNFLDALSGKIAMVSAVVVAKFGEESPQWMSCFPEGRSVFSRGKTRESAMNNKLTGLVSALTNLQAQLGAQVVTDATALKTQWDTLYADAQSGKSGASGNRLSTKDARTALEREAQLTLLAVAAQFLGDFEKMDFYCPQNLLRNPVATTPPPKPSLSGEWNAETSKVLLVSDAAEFRVQRRNTGTEEWEDNIANATSPLELGDMAPGSYDYRVIAVNAAGESEPSDPVTVVVP